MSKIRGLKRLFKSVLVHTCTPSTQRQRQVDLCELEVSLVYRVSFRTARAI